MTRRLFLLLTLCGAPLAAQTKPCQECANACKDYAAAARQRLAQRVAKEKSKP